MLYWTDIDEQTIYMWDASSGDLTAVRTSGRVGSFAFRKSGGMLLACEAKILKATIGGVVESEFFVVPSSRTTMRLNDGACDRDGRFLVGEYDYESPGSGGLFAVDRE